MIVVYACNDYWKYTSTVLSCGGGGGGAHYEVVACSFAGSLWVNDNDPRFVDFNKAQSFLFNMFSSYSNYLYSAETEYITSRKASKCFDSVSIFSINGIWKPPVRIWSRSSLTRTVKYAEHIWIGHVRSLYIRLLDSCKNLSIFCQGCLAWVSNFIFPFLLDFWNLMTHVLNTQ